MSKPVTRLYDASKAADMNAAQACYKAATVRMRRSLLHMAASLLGAVAACATGYTAAVAGEVWQYCAWCAVACLAGFSFRSDLDDFAYHRALRRRGLGP